MVDHVPMLLRDSAYCRANYLAHSQQPSKLALRDASKDDGAGCGAVAALMGRTFQSFWHAPTRLLSVLSGVLRPPWASIPCVGNPSTSCELPLENHHSNRGGNGTRAEYAAP